MENTEKSKNIDEVKKSSSYYYGARHTQIIMLFGLIVIGYGMRVNLSVGIVAMVDPEASSNPDIPTYDWEDTSIILSSFFWGYVLPQISAGQIAQKYGGKWLLLVSMTTCAIFGLLIPLAAEEFGSTGVMVCRALQGFSQGFFYPSAHTLLGKWAPPTERSRIGTFVYTGGPFGTVISMPVTGWISASYVGWPAVFYLYGAIGLGWVVLYYFIGSNSPAEHKSISPEEKHYIESSLGHDVNTEREPTPWKEIAKSAPVWAILLTHCGQNWGFWTLLTEIPSYMGHVMDFDIKSNGLLSAAPYLTLWILSFIFSFICDILINKSILSTGASRKLFNSIGMFIPAAALIFLSFVSKDQKGLAITLLIIAVGLNSGAFCGFNINHIDLAPNHGGTLMGITNGISNVFSIIAPLTVHFVVTDEKDPDQWKVVFLTAAGVYVVANLIYMFFASGEVQPWNSSKDLKAKAEVNQGA